jgi:hypothetical protein
VLSTKVIPRLKASLMQKYDAFGRGGNCGRPLALMRGSRAFFLIG